MNEIVNREPERAPAMIDRPRTMLDVIAEAASNPAFDMERLKELNTLRKEVQAEEAQRAFQAAMSEAQAEMPSVVKNAENSHLKSKYAQLEAIDDAIRPVYTRHGFSLMFSHQNTEEAGGIVVVCTVLHRAGHSVTQCLPGKVDVGPGRSAIQAVGSSISYLRRYLTCMIFNVVMRNEDRDGPSQRDTRTITESQREVLENLISDTRTDIAKFCGHYRIEKIGDLSRADYVTAHARMSARKATPNA